VLARAGVASRREAERLIEAGRVALNGVALTSPAVNVGPGDIVTLDGKVIADREPARLWLHHKPAGLITTHKDPKGRPTVFDRLPKTLPRVMSVGRLDINSEGLLLLTNDGDLARALELPSTGLVRRYRARAYGRASQAKLDTLKAGIVVDGIAYGPIEAVLEGAGAGGGANVWIALALAEGKNREVRKVLDAIGLKVSRLIRVSYGPFELGDLPSGAVAEVPARDVRALLAGNFEPAPPPAAAKRPPQSAEPVLGSASGRARGRTAPPKGEHPRPRSSPPGGSPRKAGEGGRTGARKPPEDPKKPYKPGWARPKPRSGPSGPKGAR
jgi:23S rRNA pseudouridine2605 synthase